MKLRAVLINILVLAAAGAMALALCEAGARLILRPADYLAVQMVSHPALGATPAPRRNGGGGLDAWGFRNRAVPDHADIVAIGDSHTYGNTATMDDSWPHVLGHLVGRDVYNMGLGGYGPNQYYELFRTKALSLKPRTIICAIYTGDDFENAYLITYGLPYWSALRRIPSDQVNFDIWEEEPPALSIQKRLRVWLSQHSVVYQIVVHGPVLGRLRGNRQIESAAASDSVTTLRIPEKNILEAFRPGAILTRLNQDDPRIREGMRIAFSLFAEMNATCRREGIQFLVVVIPTKEMVFADYLQADTKNASSDVIRRLLASEKVARERMFEFFSSEGISFVDPLSALRQATSQELYARTTTDMHPGKQGYGVIAQVIADAVKTR